MFGKKKSKDTKQLQYDGNSNSNVNIADDGFSDFFDDEQDAGSTGYTDSTDSTDYNNVDNVNNSVSIPDQALSKDKADKKSKKKDKKKKSDNADGTPVEKQKMLLFLIIDREIDGILGYFRQSGVNVSNIFYNITEAKNEVLMQTEPLRIVIVDTGMGKFTTTSMRGELIDMLGISDEQNKTSVFYTDSVLKVDTLRSLGKSGKAIDWQKYESTALVVATLLSYNEEYVIDSESDKVEDTVKEGLDFKGLTCGFADAPRMDISGFGKDAIITHVLNDTTDCLPGFKIDL